MKEAYFRATAALPQEDEVEQEEEDQEGDESDQRRRRSKTRKKASSTSLPIAAAPCRVEKFYFEEDPVPDVLYPACDDRDFRGIVYPRTLLLRDVDVLVRPARRLEEVVAKKSKKRGGSNDPTAYRPCREEPVGPIECERSVAHRVLQRMHQRQPPADAACRQRSGVAVGGVRASSNRHLQ